MAFKTFKCSKCDVFKSPDRFPIDNRGFRGFASECKKCKNIRDRGYRLKNIGAERARRRKYAETHKKELAVYAKKYVAANKEKMRVKWRNAYYKYHTQNKCRDATKAAVKSGALKKKPCKCGAKKVQAHHEDYSQPLKVKWLCHSCHVSHHRKIRH